MRHAGLAPIELCGICTSTESTPEQSKQAYQESNTQQQYGRDICATECKIRNEENKEYNNDDIIIHSKFYV